MGLFGNGKVDKKNNPTDKWRNVVNTQSGPMMPLKFGSFYDYFY